MLLLPPWLGYAMVLFATSMFLWFPYLIATAHMRHSDKVSAFTAYGFTVAVCVGYSLWVARRRRRTILESDENGYTIRIEILRPRRSQKTGD